MIPGPLLLMGDSITVGYAPHVQVQGEKRTIAEVSKTSDWLLTQTRAFVASQDAERVKGGLAIVLIGTNDIGQFSAQHTLSNVEQIYRLLKGAGLRVVAATIPPFRGWQNYASQYQAIDQRRRLVNAGILSSSSPDKILRLDTALADPTDDSKLAPRYDSSDHLHPNGKALASLIESELQGPIAPVSPIAPKAQAAAAASPFGIAVTVAGLGLAGALGYAWYTRGRR